MTNGIQLPGVFVVVAAVLSGGACASSAPPRELLEARVVYANVVRGTAAEVLPNRVAEAKQALDQAEQAWRDGARAEAEDWAYVAWRRAQLAAVQSEAVLAAEQASALRAESVANGNTASELQVILPSRLVPPGEEEGTTRTEREPEAEVEEGGQGR